MTPETKLVSDPFVDQMQDYAELRSHEFNTRPPYANFAIIHWVPTLDNTTFHDILESEAFDELLVVVEEVINNLVEFGQDVFKQPLTQDQDISIRARILAIAQKYKIDAINLAKTLCGHSNLRHQAEDWHWEVYTYVGALFMDAEDYILPAQAAA